MTATTSVHAARALTAQQRLMLDFIDPSADSYYLTILAFAIDGRGSADRLRAAVEQFVLVNPSAGSVIDGNQEIPRPDLVGTIWEHGAPAASVDEAVAVGLARAGRPIDLHAELPLRWWSAETPDATVLVVAAHHLVFDAWSIGLMLEAVGREFREPGSLRFVPAPPVGAGTPDLDGWEDLLGREYSAVRKIAARAAGERTGPAGHIRLDWPELSARGLRKVARARRATPFALGGAAALGALQHLLGDDDVIFGSASAGRATAEELDHVGYYSTTIFLGSEGRRGVDELLDAAAGQTRRWQRRPRVQWEPLLERYGAEDLYPIKFGFQDLAQSRPALDLGGAAVRRITSDAAPGRARRPMDALLGCGTDGITGVITWRRDVFDEQDIHDFADGIRRRLTEIIHLEETP